MLTDDDYQLMKVSMLTAADAAARVANSNQTVYYDEEAFARVYESLTTLKHHCIRVFSELDLFRAMYREQVAAELRNLLGEEANDAGNGVGVVSEVSGGGVAIQAGNGAGSEPAAPVDGVEATGTEPPKKTKRPYRRRNKAGVPAVSEPVESDSGTNEMGGQAKA